MNAGWYFNKARNHWVLVRWGSGGLLLATKTAERPNGKWAIRGEVENLDSDLVKFNQRKRDLEDEVDVP